MPTKCVQGSLKYIGRLSRNEGEAGGRGRKRKEQVLCVLEYVGVTIFSNCDDNCIILSEYTKNTEWYTLVELYNM